MKDQEKEEKYKNYLWNKIYGNPQESNEENQFKSDQNSQEKQTSNIPEEYLSKFTDNANKEPSSEKKKEANQSKSEQKFQEKQTSNIPNIPEEYISQYSENTTKESSSIKQNQKEDNFIQSQQSQDINDNKYHDVIIEDMPLGGFYSANFKIKFRPLEVSEIQHYSTIDNESYSDMRQKNNDILQSCLKVYKSNGRIGSYYDIFEGDRVYLLYLLREITFQNGKLLTLPVQCDCEDDDGNKKTVEIEMVRANLEYWGENTDENYIWNYFNNNYKCFVFPVNFQNEPVVIKPPTIGIQESFFAWAKEKIKNKENIIEDFLNIAPFLHFEEDFLKYEKIEELYKWFTSEISMELFFFLRDSVYNYLKVGVKGLVKNCSQCGREARPPRGVVFPQRASDFFIVSNAFREYIRK